MAHIYEPFANSLHSISTVVTVPSFVSMVIDSGSAQQNTFTVNVGANGGFTFEPPSIHGAQNNDLVVFTLYVTHLMRDNIEVHRRLTASSTKLDRK